MAKKALISTVEQSGDPDNLGYRVIEVVNPGEEFETHSGFQWHDCGDNVESGKYWYKDGVYKKLPGYTDATEAGELAVDAEGNPTEKYVWDWDTETYSKQAL